MHIISNVSVITPNTTLHHSNVVIENGRFAAINPATLPAYPQIDGTGLIMAPGFIDLQLNGGFGDDFTESPDTIWEVARQLPQYGVTSFLPTIITSPLETVIKAQNVLKNQPKDWQGATPLGLHLEGPFLNPQKKGAHNAGYMQHPHETAVSNWSPENNVLLVTLAPELKGALPVIRTLADRGVLVSAGHSMATYEQAKAGFDAGVRYGTHLFNAMPSLHHRQPGLIGALLEDERVTIGIIPDGVHVHSSLLNMVWHTVGNGRLSIVTDSMAAMGMPPGKYALGNHQVTVDYHKSTLPNGTLAGSIVTMDDAILKMMDATGASYEEILPTATSTPAKLLNRPQLGRIETGCQADFVLLTQAFKIQATFINGQRVFQK